MAANAIADKSAEKPIIRFATGPKNGNYQYFGELLKKKADKVDIQLRTYRRFHGEPAVDLIR